MWQNTFSGQQQFPPAVSIASCRRAIHLYLLLRPQANPLFWIPARCQTCPNHPSCSWLTQPSVRSSGGKRRIIQVSKMSENNTIGLIWQNKQNKKSLRMPENNRIGLILDLSLTSCASAWLREGRPSALKDGLHWNK